VLSAYGRPGDAGVDQAELEAETAQVRVIDSGDEL
jgi:hypothetical protein